jgi:hypothetical protein
MVASRVISTTAIVADVERPDRPQSEIERDREVLPNARKAIAHPCGGALAAGRRADRVGNLAAALQDDDDDEEMHHQHHDAEQRQIAGAMQAQQKCYIGKGDAGYT